MFFASLVPCTFRETPHMERELHWAIPPEIQQNLALGGIFLAVAVLYCLPFLVAVLRRHPHTTAIFAAGVLLGWTVYGWLIALVWSLSAIEVGKRYR